MGKPENIPQDVWDAAAKVVHAFCGCSPGRIRANGSSHADVCWYQVQKVSELTLSAKAEERQACINVVLSFVRYSGKPGAMAMNPYTDAQEVAAAIRAMGAL